jgi:hypothetical protein
MSGALNAASFRWDDTRYAASHTLRSYLRSTPMRKQWNLEFNAFFARRRGYSMRRLVALAQEAEKFDALAQPPSQDLGTPDHFAGD